MTTFNPIVLLVVFILNLSCYLYFVEGDSANLLFDKFHIVILFFFSVVHTTLFSHLYSVIKMAANNVEFMSVVGYCFVILISIAMEVAFISAVK